MLFAQGQAYREQYGFNAVFLLPVNVYGPGDHFHPETSHVIPALIRKCVDARDARQEEVVVWGTGKATREFLYVQDAAEAIVLATACYDRAEPVNVGAGFEISVRELVERIVALTGFEGRVAWDGAQPDGRRAAASTHRGRSGSLGSGRVRPSRTGWSARCVGIWNSGRHAAEGRRTLQEPGVYGIAGRLNFRSGAPVDPEVLHRMGGRLAHQGSDGESVWHHGVVGLGGSSPHDDPTPARLCRTGSCRIERPARRGRDRKDTGATAAAPAALLRGDA
jgi:hypothetical protein